MCSDNNRWSVTSDSPCLAHQDEPEVTYTLRCVTGEHRSDELSEPDAPLLVALITADGRAFLHSTPTAALAGVKGSSGGVDSLEVRAPASLGVPARLLISPERGTWNVTSARVTWSGDGGTVDGQQPLQFSGTGGPELRLAAPEIVRTPEQRMALREAGMQSYTSLKNRLVGVTAALAVAGAAVARQLGGEDAAMPFLLGSMLGITYLALLEKGVDGVSGPADPMPPTEQAPRDQAPPDGQAGASGTGAGVRLVTVILLGIAAARLLAERSGGDASVLRVELASGALGFLTYKTAILLVGLWPVADSSSDDAAS